MLRQLVSAVVLSVSLAAPAQAQFIFGNSDRPFVQLILNGSTTVSATDQGWWKKESVGGLYRHIATNENYFVGVLDAGSSYRNFFLFSVPTELTITSATLRLNSYSISTTDTYRLFDFLGNTSALTADADPGISDASIYNDLGDGAFYGSRAYSSADANLTRDIALNANAISALTAARGGQFAMGGRVGGDLIDVPPQTTVPEPSTYALMAAGLSALLMMRRRRAV